MCLNADIPDANRQAATMKFRLISLFKLTGLLALLFYGITVAKVDGQTGVMIILYAIGLFLAAFTLRLPVMVWSGMTLGFLIAVVWYWWSDACHEAAPADRLFEFVVMAIWCSVPAGAIALAGSTLVRRSN
jgi:hypothetical protein